MFRKTVAIAALLAPFAALAGQGCGAEPLPEDLCSWLSDSNSCYSRFADDVGTQCGKTYVSGEAAKSTTGYFAARDDLAICIRNGGGQVIFDPALDITTFPVTSVAFKMLDSKAAACGEGSASSGQNYSIKIEYVDKNDAGANTAADGGALSDNVTGGTFAISREANREAFNVTCPGGQESHNFNKLTLDMCSQLSGLLPTAILDSSPGTPGPNNETSGESGFVRLRIVYPPTNPAIAGAAPRVVEYFNCSVPGPPPTCKDEVKNSDETDVDCGGSCTANCADGLACNENADCQSNNCGSEAGIKQCKAAG